MTTHAIDGRYVSDAEWFALLDQLARDDEPLKPLPPAERVRVQVFGDELPFQLLPEETAQ